MKGKKKNTDTNYNIQIGCCKNQFITYNEVVTQGNDKAQLIPTLKGIQSNTGQAIKIALADADYGTFASIEYMHQHQIRGYVPYSGMNTTFEDKPYHSSHFQYDQERDIYICPAHEQLHNTKRIKKDSRHDLQYRIYQTQACKDCPFKKECVPKKSSQRTIYREVRQTLRDQMRQRLNSEQGKKIYAQRLHPIEAIFGHLKYNLGYKQFLLRGLDKVKAEFNLMCIAYNLKKLVKQLLCLLFGGKSATFWTSEVYQIVLEIIFQKIWKHSFKKYHP